MWRTKHDEGEPTGQPGVRRSDRDGFGGNGSASGMKLLGRREHAQESFWCLYFAPPPAATSWNQLPGSVSTMLLPRFRPFGAHSLQWVITVLVILVMMVTAALLLRLHPPCTDRGKLE